MTLTINPQAVSNVPDVVWSLSNDPAFVMSVPTDAGVFWSIPNDPEVFWSILSNPVDDPLLAASRYNRSECFYISGVPDSR